MAGHERAPHRNKEDIDERHRAPGVKSDPSYDRYGAYGGGILGSGFAPPTERHAELLNRAGSELEREEIAFQLQRTSGNGYVQRLIQSFCLQAKLTVGGPDGPHEKERDRVAEVVPPTSKAKAQREPRREGENATLRPDASPVGNLMADGETIFRLLD